MIPNIGFAYSECRLTPNKVWMNANGVSVWICFENSKCIYKSYSGEPNDSVLNRMYSSALTAIAAGKDFYVRFPESDANCQDVLANESRNDFVGYWVLQ